MQKTELASLMAYVEELKATLKAMLPENCDLGDDPSGGHRPSFETCERARDLIKRK